MDGIFARLAHQSLGRELDERERAFANVLEAIYRQGIHDFPRVAAELNRMSVARPSGATDPWTVEVLEQELRRVNADLDKAYARNGIGA